MPTELVCPSCERLRPAADGYCVECGAALIPQRFCDRCGVIALHGGDFCRECGAALPSGAPVAQPQLKRQPEPQKRDARPFAEPPDGGPPAWAKDAPAPARPAPDATPAWAKEPPPAAPVVRAGTRPAPVAARPAPSSPALPASPPAPLVAPAAPAPLQGAQLVGWTMTALLLGILGLVAVAAEPIALPLLLVLTFASLGPLKRLAYSLLDSFIETFSNE